MFAMITCIISQEPPDRCNCFDATVNFVRRCKARGCSVGPNNDCPNGGAFNYDPDHTSNYDGCNCPGSAFGDGRDGGHNGRYYFALGRFNTHDYDSCVLLLVMLLVLVMLVVLMLLIVAIIVATVMMVIEQREYRAYQLL